MKNITEKKYVLSSLLASLQEIVACHKCKASTCLKVYPCGHIYCDTCVSKFKERSGLLFIACKTCDSVMPCTRNLDKQDTLQIIQTFMDEIKSDTSTDLLCNELMKVFDILKPSEFPKANANIILNKSESSEIFAKCSDFISTPISKTATSKNNRKSNTRKSRSCQFDKEVTTTCRKSGRQKQKNDMNDSINDDKSRFTQKNEIDIKGFLPNPKASNKLNLIDNYIKKNYLRKEIASSIESEKKFDEYKKFIDEKDKMVQGIESNNNQDISTEYSFKDDDDSINALNVNVKNQPKGRIGKSNEINPSLRNNSGKKRLGGISTRSHKKSKINTSDVEIEVAKDETKKDCKGVKSIEMDIENDELQNDAITIDKSENLVKNVITINNLQNQMKGANAIAENLCDEDIYETKKDVKTKDTDKEKKKGDKNSAFDILKQNEHTLPLRKRESLKNVTPCSKIPNEHTLSNLKRNFNLSTVEPLCVQKSKIQRLSLKSGISPPNSSSNEVHNASIGKSNSYCEINNNKKLDEVANEKSDEVINEKLHEAADDKLNEVTDEKLNAITDDKLNEVTDEKFKRKTDDKLHEMIDDKLNEVTDNKKPDEDGDIFDIQNVKSKIFQLSNLDCDSQQVEIESRQIYEMEFRSPEKNSSKQKFSGIDSDLLTYRSQTVACQTSPSLHRALLYQEFPQLIALHPDFSSPKYLLSKDMKQNLRNNYITPISNKVLMKTPGDSATSGTVVSSTTSSEKKFFNEKAFMSSSILRVGSTRDFNDEITDYISSLKAVSEEVTPKNKEQSKNQLMAFKSLSSYQENEEKLTSIEFHDKEESMMVNDHSMKSLEIAYPMIPNAENSATSNKKENGMKEIFLKDSMHDNYLADVQFTDNSLFIFCKNNDTEDVQKSKSDDVDETLIKCITPKKQKLKAENPTDNTDVTDVEFSEDIVACTPTEHQQLIISDGTLKKLMDQSSKIDDKQILTDSTNLKKDILHYETPKRVPKLLESALPSVNNISKSDQIKSAIDYTISTKEKVHGSKHDDTVDSISVLYSEEKNRNKTKYSFVTTGLPVSDANLVKRFTEKMGVEYSNKITDETTHLVVKVDENNRVLRTFKYLQALSKRLRIVTLKWVDLCYKENIFLKEENFIPVDFSGECGPFRAFLALRGLGNSLSWVKDYCILFTEPIPQACTLPQLQEIARDIGATVINKPEEFRKYSKYHHIVIVADEIDNEALPDKQITEWLYSYKAVTIQFSWLLEVLGRYRLIPFVIYEVIPVPSEYLLQINFPAEMLQNEECSDEEDD